jgi:hypothetical protein
LSKNDSHSFLRVKHFCEKCWKKIKDVTKTTTVHKGNNPPCNNTYFVSSDDKQQTNKLRQRKTWHFVESGIKHHKPNHKLE